MNRLRRSYEKKTGRPAEHDDSRPTFAYVEWLEGIIDDGDGLKPVAFCKAYIDEEANDRAWKELAAAMREKE